MNRLTLLFKWYYAFTKRLLLKPSFMLVLLIVPAVVVVSYFASNEERGLATIAIAAEDSKSASFEAIAKDLSSDSSAIIYKRYATREEAIQSIADGKSAYAWIFKDNFEERLASYASGEDIVLCEIICKEETMMSKVTSEKLFGVLYKHLSKELFLDFMREKSYPIDNANDAYLSEYFDSYASNIKSDIISFVFLDDEDKKIEDANYLTSPLKGLLAACMLICCIAAMMYSLDDEKAGKYSMFAVSSRFFLHFTSVFSAAVLVAFVVYFSMLISGAVNHYFVDAVVLIFYALISTVFCVFLGIIFRSSKSLCVFLPVLTIVTITLCPVFVNIKGYEPLKNLLPAYHYLKSASDWQRICHMVAYFAVFLLVDIVIYKLLSRKT